MTDYELTRRDALAALAASGAAVGAAALTWDSLSGDELGERERATLLAVARTVYPTAVSGVDSFVETYVVGRIEDRPEYAAGVRDAVRALDEHCRAWQDAPFRELSANGRDAALRDLGVGRSDPDPDGDRAARIRYYLVNELLYALFTSPTGGRLVGLENPQGYPGGTDSYQRPPPDER
ncbi:MAG: gluconate 2-dehydrogenase subunit 3 family protein [Haloarculaceae archaeon]